MNGSATVTSGRLNEEPGVNSTPTAIDNQLGHSQTVPRLKAWNLLPMLSLMIGLSPRRVSALSASVVAVIMIAVLATAAIERQAGLRGDATVLSAAVVLILSVISIVGWLLVTRGASFGDSSRLVGQQELRELLAVSESEEESRDLLIRHLQRNLPASRVAVLECNDRENRLEVKLGTGVDDGPLVDLPLDFLKRRSCLAVRLGRPYQCGPDEQPLVHCETCGKVAAEISCEPMRVAGQVIGSVLIASPERLNVQQTAALHDAVSLAAPFRANQRNLAEAERRSTSDALTGLPNRTAAFEELKRMAANAGRTITPLSAIVIDLDRFRQVNELHGIDRADKALATIGQLLAASLRASDFAARFGGEEFLLLLPDTDRNGALDVAEKLRRVIERTELRDVGRLTASLGTATLPDDAVDPERLVRKADRALFAAKAQGRNRVAVASMPPRLDRPGLLGGHEPPSPDAE